MDRSRFARDRQLGLGRAVATRRGKRSPERDTARAMPQANKEVVREAVDATNRRDLDAFKACLHRHVEWEETADAFPGLRGTYRGREEVEKWSEQASQELWKNLHLEVEELTETSDGGILLGTLITARGTASGVGTEQRAWQLFWFADGKIIRRHGPFWTRGKALKAAGLRR